MQYIVGLPLEMDYEIPSANHILGTSLNYKISFFVMVIKLKNFYCPIKGVAYVDFSKGFHSAVRVVDYRLNTHALTVSFFGTNANKFSIACGYVAIKGTPDFKLRLCVKCRCIGEVCPNCS